MFTTTTFLMVPSTILHRHQHVSSGSTQLALIHTTLAVHQYHRLLVITRYRTPALAPRWWIVMHLPINVQVTDSFHSIECAMMMGSGGPGQRT
jgi:hypothetical protein